MRWHDVGLGLLALVAAALAVLTFRAVDRAPVTGQPAASFTAAPEESVTSTGPHADGDGSTAGDDVEERTGGSAPSSLPAVRELLQQDESLVVAALGDSTGNETWEWVYLWAGMLAETRPVSIAPWNEWTESGYVEATVLSTEGPGEGGPGPVMIWSGHQSGAGAGYPVDRLESLLPEQPDLVILNYGHNNTVEDVRDELEATLEALREAAGEDLPVVVTLQQPQLDDANAEVRRAVADFAAEHGLGVIDVADAFADTGDPASLLADAIHPDADGEQLWAETVADTLQAP